jgi:hypothetical protein
MLILGQVREAIAHLNPADVREAAERPVKVRITAFSSGAYAAIENFLAPNTLSRRKRSELIRFMYRAGDPDAPGEPDLEIVEAGIELPRDGVFAFEPHRPMDLVKSVIAAREELGLALARSFPPFRSPVIERIIRSIARENAIFTLMTSLPHLAPSLTLPFEMPDSVSDTAFLTVNQIRMGFLVAAASDRPAGYREQKTEIALMIAGAFAWRALARKGSGWLTYGAGIIPKAAISYAGTYILGRSLERLYRTGYDLTREERQQAYGDALARGRQVATAVVSAWWERSSPVRYEDAR